MVTLIYEKIVDSREDRCSGLEQWLAFTQRDNGAEKLSPSNIITFYHAEKLWPEINRRRRFRDTRPVP